MGLCRSVSSWLFSKGDGGRTLAEVPEVEQLVIPLCYDPNSIFNEGNDDQETSDSRQISLQKLSACYSSPAMFCADGLTV